MDGETCSEHVLFEKGKKLIYVVVLRSIYDMLVASLLFYNKVCGYFENIEFYFDPYDTCVTNRIKVGKQRTV